MKMYSFIAIPLAFVAGIVSIVLLQKMDVVHMDVVHMDGMGGDGRAMSGQQVQTSVEESDPESLAADRQVQASTASGGSNADILTVRMDTLQQLLRDSTLSADKMQARINELEEKFDDALEQSAFLPSGEVVVEQGDALSEQTNEAARRGEGRGGRNNNGFGGGFGNDLQYDNLLAAGVDPAVAEELKRQSDQWALQRLELIDQASREGWRRSDEFGERMEALREVQPDIREELGEKSYDRYLYTAGESNRVEVSNILDGSAAQLAGMQYGDVVVSYANSRVFTSRELQRATRDGSRGESVQVELLRDGQLISVDLPRGPLGVTLSGTRVEPTQN